MAKPKLCLIGCGAIGALHAKNLRPHAELFFCSRSRRSAQRFYDRFGGRGVLPDLEAVLNSDVDGVVIASPPEYHAEQAVAALGAGKAVLVEKPMCASPEEVAAIGSALAGDALLMVAENYYYKPSLAYIKGLIAQGAIGRVQSVTVKKLTLQRAAGWKIGYGALLEGGIHFVALISDLFDAAPAMVEAVFPERDGDKPERESIVRMTYADGAVANLHYSWRTPSMTKGVFQHSRIEGERGRIAFESNGIYVWRSGAALPVFPGLNDLMGYGAMTRDFLACLADRTRRPYSDFARAKRDLQVVFDAYLEMG